MSSACNGPVRALKNDCLRSTTVFQSVEPSSPLKIRKSFHQHRCCREADTSVGHRRRVQPHTPALTWQPEKRLSSLPAPESRPCPSPFSKSCFPSLARRPLRLTAEVNSGRAARSGPGPPSSEKTHDINLPVPFVLPNRRSREAETRGRGGNYSPRCLSCLFCLSCLSCLSCVSCLPRKACETGGKRLG